MCRTVALLTAAILLLFSSAGLCKCANRLIQIEGFIAGPFGGDLKVVVHVSPDPNRESQPEISMKDGKFVGTAYFDSTKSEGRVRDNCSRVPETVEVVLLKTGRGIDRVQLNISRDFVKSKIGDYKLRSPITLRSQ